MLYFYHWLMYRWYGWLLHRQLRRFRRWAWANGDKNAWVYTDQAIVEGFKRMEAKR